MSLRVVSWSENTPITPDSLNALSSNIQWLNQNKVTGVWVGDGNQARVTNVVLIGGHKVLSYNTGSHANNQVGFGNSFSSACNPVVTASLVSETLTRLTVITSGIGSAIRPSHSGCVFKVRTLATSDAKGQKYVNLEGSIRVAWMALGWK